MHAAQKDREARRAMWPLSWPHMTDGQLDDHCPLCYGSWAIVGWGIPVEIRKEAAITIFNCVIVALV